MEIVVTLPGNDPLPWYIAGPLLGLFVPLFLLLTGKDLGVSSSFRHFCAALLPSKARVKLEYFNYDWKTGLWQILFVVGIILGGVVSAVFFGGANIPLSTPENWTWGGALGLFGGGLLVGFGTRWADGCTSGHTIAGLSQLQVSSLVASVCFIVGGLAASVIHHVLTGNFNLLKGIL